jgi:hypothetical protein
MSVEICANCGEKIGALEPAHVWQSKIVCAGCLPRLSKVTPAPSTEFDPMEALAMEAQQALMRDQVQAPANPPVRRVLAAGDIVCPNPRCNYAGPPKKEARASTAAGCLLMFFFLLPGILYFMFKNGYRYLCPKCGTQIRSDG